MTKDSQSLLCIKVDNPTSKGPRYLCERLRGSRQGMYGAAAHPRSNFIKVFKNVRIFLWANLISLGGRGIILNLPLPAHYYSPNHWNGHSAAPGIGSAAAGGEETEKAVDVEPPALPRSG